ncbi:MAG: tRNA pseudouridine(38-40) synthase TruA [Proteobacteria bacterium]|nr:tRNA pseudouridine(38-40) synthase TruA [Pseudomonadota bacterium]
MKVAFGVEYDGSKFFGWQRQTNARTVQACVEEALSKVADCPLKIYCAGRTDTGVHATGQVIHVDTVARRTTRSWVLGANSNLPNDVSILWAQPVEDDFHARFSATGRTYQYVICNRVARPGLWSTKSSFIFKPLDADKMREAAQNLVGTHDFSSFRAAGCQSAHPIREVRRIDVRRQGHFVTVEVEANAFLQHMVRNIVGTLIAVGVGYETPSHVATVLNARSRVAAGPTAAPDGLYLIAVSYPAKFDLPSAVPNQLISAI